MQGVSTMMVSLLLHVSLSILAGCTDIQNITDWQSEWRLAGA